MQYFIDHFGLPSSIILLSNLPELTLQTVSQIGSTFSSHGCDHVILINESSLYLKFNSVKNSWNALHAVLTTDYGWNTSKVSIRFADFKNLDATQLLTSIVPLCTL